MDLNKLVNSYLNNGYSRPLAISRVCQDVILAKISDSNFNRNVTIYISRWIMKKIIFLVLCLFVIGCSNVSNEELDAINNDIIIYLSNNQ